MPWAGNPPLESHYVQLTWYPPEQELEDAVNFAHSLPLNGLEYEDGRQAESPFTDIPLAPGRPFVRVYMPQDAAHEWTDRIRAHCADHRWLLEEHPVASQDWSSAWKAYYSPFSISGGYMIVPSWLPEYATDEAHTLLLDPGMAFGTGTHATTRMCLDALADIDVAGKRVLDLGAGSGILGLIAALKGAGVVVAVEPDPVAVDAIRHNSQLNHLEDRVKITPGTLQDVAPAPFDVLCLNLIWDIILSEWIRVQRYLAPGATLLLSGILAERKDEVRRMVHETGQTVGRVEEAEGWLMVVVRHDSPLA